MPRSGGGWQLLDRLLHHATVLQMEGSSYRLRHHADLVPEAMCARQIVATPPPKRRGRPPKARVSAGDDG